MTKFYAVAVGRTTGIFEKWEDCKASVEWFSGSKFKIFNTREEAEKFLLGNGVVATAVVNSSSNKKLALNEELQSILQGDCSLSKRYDPESIEKKFSKYEEAQSEHTKKEKRRYNNVEKD